MPPSLPPLSALPHLEPAVWVGVVAAVLAMQLLWLLTRRRQPPNRLFDLNPANRPSDSTIIRALDWTPPPELGQGGERRRSTRRVGVPTAVLLVDRQQGRNTQAAYVLDRSTGGLRLAVQNAFPQGTTLEVRAENAPEGTPWVPVSVRSCRRVNDFYEIGCQFEQELPWSILLLFG